LLVIGVRNEVPDDVDEVLKKPGVPSLGELAGYMLDVLFSDSLFADLERLTRINQFVDELGAAGMEETGLPFKRVETMIILPSQDVRQIAERHVHELPRGLRMLLGGLGAGKKGNAQLISYLLFESGFCREMIDLGYRDAMAERTRLRAFLTGEPAPALDAPPRLKRQLTA
jgi:NTE family protein